MQAVGSAYRRCKAVGRRLCSAPSWRGTWSATFARLVPPSAPHEALSPPCWCLTPSARGGRAGSRMARQPCLPLGVGGWWTEPEDIGGSQSPYLTLCASGHHGLEVLHSLPPSLGGRLDAHRQPPSTLWTRWSPSQPRSGRASTASSLLQHDRAP